MQLEDIYNTYQDKVALVVLGGPSAKYWRDIPHDVLIGVNGVNRKIKNLDFWLCTENMTYPNGKADKGEDRYIDIMKMFQLTGAKHRLVNTASYDYLKNKEGVVRIQRHGTEIEELHLYSFREYGKGFINGALFKSQGMRGALRVGTVALQAIHLAGILGCAEVHTIGFDMHLPEKHHWYDYPPYEETRFFTKDMFIDYEGMKTMYFWTETADYLEEADEIMLRDGMDWTDHSHGLLKKRGLRPAMKYRMCHQGKNMFGKREYEEHRQFCEVCE